MRGKQGYAVIAVTVTTSGAVRDPVLLSHRAKVGVLDARHLKPLKN